MKLIEITEEEIDRMADNFVNTQYFTRVYSVARKAECGVFWKYGFLAGLKAGKPQWHNTEETPPEDKKYKGCSIVVFDENCTKIHKYENRWFEDISGNETYPLAWCEIPKYTEE